MNRWCARSVVATPPPYRGRDRTAGGERQEYLEGRAARPIKTGVPPESAVAYRDTKVCPVVLVDDGPNERRGSQRRSVGRHVPEQRDDGDDGKVEPVDGLMPVGKVHDHIIQLASGSKIEYDRRSMGMLYYQVKLLCLEAKKSIYRANINVSLYAPTACALFTAFQLDDECVPSSSFFSSLTCM